MTDDLRRPGEIYDRVVGDRRRLAIAHFSLGLITSFIYFIRPTSFHPRVMIPGNYGFTLVAVTLIAWVPYLLSWRVSREILSGSKRGVMVFIPLAVAITIGAAAFYLNLWGFRLPILALSACVALLLIGAAALCAIIGGELPDR